MHSCYQQIIHDVQVSANVTEIASTKTVTFTSRYDSFTETWKLPVYLKNQQTFSASNKTICYLQNQLSHYLTITVSTNADANVNVSIALQQKRISIGLREPLSQNVIPTTAAKYWFTYKNAIFSSSSIVLNVNTEGQGCFTVSIQQPTVSRFHCLLKSISKAYQIYFFV